MLLCCCARCLCPPSTVWHRSNPRPQRKECPSWERSFRFSNIRPVACSQGICNTVSCNRRKQHKYVFRWYWIIARQISKGNICLRYVQWKKRLRSAAERWIEQMILTLAGQSQRLSHMYTCKISGVFQGIRWPVRCRCRALTNWAMKPLRSE